MPCYKMLSIKTPRSKMPSTKMPSTKMPALHNAYIIKCLCYKMPSVTICPHYRMPI